MSKVKDLIETAARHTHDRTDVVIRVRVCRNNRILPADGRKHSGPQIETVHAVSLILALLKAGPQVYAAEAVRELWTLPGYCMTVTTNGPNGPHKATTFDRSVLTFGQYVASFVEMGASADPDQRAYLPRLFSRVTVSRDYEFAQIETPDGVIRYFQKGSYNPALAGVMATATSADPATIQDFANLVRHSREEAARLGTTVPVEDAYRALGLLPPNGPGSPKLLPPGTPGLPVSMPGIDGSVVAFATPETTTAEKPASSSAVAGQTASPQPCPRFSRHGIAGDTHTQDVCASQRSDLFESGDVPATSCVGDSAGEAIKKGSPDDRSDRPHPALRAAA